MGRGKLDYTLYFFVSISVVNLYPGGIVLMPSPEAVYHFANAKAATATGLPDGETLGS